MSLHRRVKVPDNFEMPGDRPIDHHLHLHYTPILRDLKRELGQLRGRVLDVGCGVQPYRSLLGPGVTDHVGVDRRTATSDPDVEGDALSLPFEDASFDAVFSTQVLEHVTDPRKAMAESFRVLKPGGRLVATLPGCWPAHEIPYDFWRFTRWGITTIAAETGFTNTRVEVQGGTWATIGQMIALELHHHPKLERALVPTLNRASLFLDRRGTREELVMNWLLVAERPRG